MPTPIQIVKYCCNICGYNYANYNTALMCEAGPIIPEHIKYKVGDHVPFHVVDDVTQSRSMSTYETGLVLAKVYLTAKNEAGFFEHHVAYLVKCREDGDFWEERIVIWVDNNNIKELHGPPHFRYKQDYHHNLPKNLRLIEHIDHKHAQPDQPHV